MGQTTSNRKGHKESLEKARKSDLQPGSGKKSGEVASLGHGPAVNKNPGHRWQGQAQNEDRLSRRDCCL